MSDPAPATTCRREAEQAVGLRIRVDCEEPVGAARRRPGLRCPRRCSRYRTCASSSRAARHARRARRCLLLHRARRDPRRGRRIGRRQVADRHGDDRPARSARPDRRRRDPPRRPAHRQPAARGDAQDARPAIGAIFQDPLTSLHPLLHGRRAAGRDDPDASAGERGRRAQARARPAPGGRHPRRRGRVSTSIRTSSRAACASASSSRSRSPASPADHRRRADDRARRLDPGADHLAAEAPLPEHGTADHAGHARHGRDRRDGRPRRGDVCRPRSSRSGPVEAVIHAPAHPYTAGLMASIPALDVAARASPPDRRRDAAPERDPLRLRLQSALRRAAVLRAAKSSVPELMAAACHARRLLAAWRRRLQAGRDHAALVQVDGARASPSTSRCPWLDTGVARARSPASSCAPSTTSPSRSSAATRSASSANRAAASPPSARLIVGLYAPTRAASSSTASSPRRRTAPALDPPPLADDLPGPLRQPQSALARRATSSPSRCARTALRARARRSGAASASASCSRRSASPRADAEKYPARVLRRPAAAHLDRARARDRARVPRLRRADLRARRLGAGADPQPHEGPAGASTASPTSSSRTTSRWSAHVERRGRRHVPRPHRRDRPTRRCSSPGRAIRTRACCSTRFPTSHMSGKARTPVPGEVPNPLNPPSGCTFNPRCPHATNAAAPSDRSSSRSTASASLVTPSRSGGSEPQTDFGPAASSRCSPRIRSAIDSRSRMSTASRPDTNTSAARGRVL